MIMIIIKLLIKKKYTHPHTHRDNPPWLFWAAFLGVQQLNFGLWTLEEASQLPLSPLSYPNAPVLQGGVCVCGVRLVGIGGVWGNNGEDWITELIAPSEERATQSKDGRSAPDPPERPFVVSSDLRSTFSLCFSAWGSFKQTGWLQ